MLTGRVLLVATHPLYQADVLCRIPGARLSVALTSERLSLYVLNDAHAMIVNVSCKCEDTFAAYFNVPSVFFFCSFKDTFQQLRLYRVEW